MPPRFKVRHPYLLSACSMLFPAVVTAMPAIAQAADDAATLPAVTVTAPEPTQSAPADDPAKAGAGFRHDKSDMGPLGDKDALDIPTSVNTVTSAMMENTDMTSVSDPVKYLPSTQFEARFGMDQGRLQSRGMQGSVWGNTHQDGFNINVTTAYPMEMFDRLEVINGVVGALYGPANPSGTFNFYTKRPTKTPLLRFSTGYGNGSQWKEAVDISNTVGKVGYRFNVMHQEGEGYVTGSEQRRTLASADIDVHFNDSTVLELDGSYYDFLSTGYPGIFAFTSNMSGMPGVADPTKQGYGVSGAGMKLKNRTASFLVKHDFNADWSLKFGLLRQLLTRQLAVPTMTMTKSANGTWSYTNKITPRMASYMPTTSNQITLNGKVKTGPIDHELVIATNGYTTSGFGSVASSAITVGSSIDYVNPTTYASSGDYFVIGHGNRTSQSGQQSFVLGDTLNYGPKWALQLVSSYSYINSHSYTESATTSSYEHGWSPSVALTYKPIPSLSTYVGYADSLQAGDTVTDTDAKNYGETLDPYRSKQLEAGAKWRVGGVLTQAAVFRLERPIVYLGSDGYYGEQGNQINHGLELSATGNATQNLALFGGVTFLDPRVKSTELASTENKLVVGTARVQANLLAEYSINYVPGLVLTGNVHYTGRRAVNTTNTAFVAPYSTEDIGARYTTRLHNYKTVFRFNIDNVFDKHYWASIFPSDTDGSSEVGSKAFLGSPRTFNLSMTVDL